jgi:DEAD/DEAH box helicase domain-containing protein
MESKHEKRPLPVSEPETDPVERLVAELFGSDPDALGCTIVHHEKIPARPARVADTSEAVCEELAGALAKKGITKLYSHQAKAIGEALRGRNVVVATPTASGKSLIFHLPVFQRVLRSPKRTALFIYPLKALERDQLEALRELAVSCGLSESTVDVLDGDVSATRRKKLKADPPRILVTTPDMLHHSICAYHSQWEKLLATLDYVVADELHTYRGIFGSHVALVFRRLKRLCRFYGAEPTFMSCSATISNPEELALRLFDLEDVFVCRKSGAPASARHFLVTDPAVGSSTAALRLFLRSIQKGLRTIVFARSRKTTELIHTWARSAAPELAGRISSYRSGYRPSERRSIEADLASGRLLGVVSTSALELGIDIGGLDVCILVGYPGSITATFQRSGRVGRADRPSATILVSMQDALDQYFVTNPEQLFRREAEAVSIDPANEHVLSTHLECAAAELPLRSTDWPFCDPRSAEMVESCVARGKLFESAAGGRWFPARPMPHRHVDLRNAGEGFRIVTESAPGKTGRKRRRTIGTSSGTRALRECHPGAIYLHRGSRYLVETLDMEEKLAVAKKTDETYYTQVRSERETEILSLTESRPVGGSAGGSPCGPSEPPEPSGSAPLPRFVLRRGKLRVTERIVGFAKRRLTTGRTIEILPLEMEPTVFDTEGMWLELDGRHEELLLSGERHLMGSLHATEHALISLFPLRVLCDRSDIGGICYTLHPQLEKPAIFVYDGYSGGAGLAKAGYGVIEKLLAAVRDLLASCPCRHGCPSCIHSPKCGSGNKPLDKKGALLLVEALRGERKLPTPAEKAETSGQPGESGDSYQSDQPELSLTIAPLSSTSPGPATGRAAAQPPQGDGWRTLPLSGDDGQRLVVFDLETQLSAQDVGGWQNAHLMRVAVGVVYDSHTDSYTAYDERRVDDLIAHLHEADLVCGFNILEFDYSVLSAYADRSLKSLPTFDLLADIHARIGFRVGLENLSTNTLGRGKSANGLQSLEWVRQGRLDLVERYCRDDVRVTADLLRFGIAHQYVLYFRKRHGGLRIPVDWHLARMFQRVEANGKMSP